MTRSNGLRHTLSAALERLAPSPGLPGGLILPPVELRAGGHHFAADRDFVRSAAHEVDVLRKWAALTPASRVLDVGCGAGRLAYGLIGQYGGTISYDGVDVMSQPIEWCLHTISALYPSYRFTRIDVRNERYNPDGSGDPTRSELPFPPGAFDVIYAYSVFSHMRGPEVEAYLHEFARLLSANGMALATAFVEDDVEDEAVNPPNYGPIAWSGALHCVRFSRSYLERVVREAGLSLTIYEHGEETDGQSRLLIRTGP